MHFSDLYFAITLLLFALIYSNSKYFTNTNSSSALRKYALLEKVCPRVNSIFFSLRPGSSFNVTRSSLNLFIMASWSWAAGVAKWLERGTDCYTRGNFPRPPAYSASTWWLAGYW